MTYGYVNPGILLQFSWIDEEKNNNGQNFIRAFMFDYQHNQLSGFINNLLLSFQNNKEVVISL